MAESRGRILRINWQANILCVHVGRSMTNTELLTLQFLPEDLSSVTQYKRLVAKLLATALANSLEVAITHADSDPRIDGVLFIHGNISPIGPAIRNDLYAISGSNIPASAMVVFESDTTIVVVAPDVVRPHWLLLEQLPMSVPTGRCEVFLSAPGWMSDRVPITVMEGPPAIARTLYSGRPSTTPYTIVFVASPASETTAGAIVTDGILTNRAGFQDVVRHCLDNMFNENEDVLRIDGFERQVRLVSIFDTLQPGSIAANTLIRQVAPDMTEALRDRMNDFVRRYWEDPDIVFCVTDSAVYTRATAWPSTDDNGRASTAFAYDGVARAHGHFTDIPGAAALSTNMDMTGLTAIHEFLHAASDFNNGWIDDLYVDDQRTVFCVNKKFRTTAGSTIPANFGTYEGVQYASDTARDGLGYPATWRHYQAAPRNAAVPNLMDDFWQPTTSTNCLLDGLTYEWLRDRLNAKIMR